MRNKLTTFRLWLLSVIITVSLAELMVVSIAWLANSRLNHDDLFGALVSSLLASVVIGAMFIAVQGKQGNDVGTCRNNDYAPAAPGKAGPEAPNNLELVERHWMHRQLEKALAVGNRSNKCGALLHMTFTENRFVQEPGEIEREMAQQIKQHLVQSVRKSDSVAQIGNAEFYVLLENIGDSNVEAAITARTVAAQVVEKLRQSNGLCGEHIASHIGITVFDNQAANAASIFSSANFAMHEATKEKKSSIRFSELYLDELIKTRAELEAELTRALEDGQLILHYQPQLNSRDRIIGAEALLRWQHPRRGLLTFSEMGLNEGPVLNPDLAHWTMTTACMQLAAWASSSRTAHLTLSVNVSNAQFRQDEFVQGVLAALETADINPQRLKLELTENTLTSHSEAISKLHRLKASGIGICLDNFGNDQASLNSLKRLPLQQVKIGQGLVRNMIKNTSDAAVVRAIVALGRSLDFSVMAEGVEERGQRDMLAALECHTYQGFLFSKALPVDQFEQLFYVSQKQQLASPITNLIG
jgi:EAL domain-containing protein (putative c-di-GMP-specific phosphodiesterase class I)/GGDEF domain-containing protein